MLSDEVIRLLKQLDVEILDRPQDLRIDVPYEELPPALGQFLYCLEWPVGLTYEVLEVDDPLETEMWMMNFGYEPLELLTKDHGDCYDGTFLMCGIYDGGNYLLVVKRSDMSDDPEVFSLDHDDDGVPYKSYKFSEFLSRMKAEPPDKYAEEEPAELTEEELAEREKHFHERMQKLLESIVSDGHSLEEAKEMLGWDQLMSQK